MRVGLSGRRIGVVAMIVVAAAAGFATAASVWSSSTLPTPGESVSPSVSPSVAPSVTVAPSPSPSESPSPSATFDREAFSIDDPASPWFVGNKTRPLDPLEYIPIDMAYLTGIPNGSDQQMRTEAAAALQALYAAAHAEGLGFHISTAYRSHGHQASIYQDWVNKNGQAWADESSARPGYSEHQTGWAVDIYDTDECRLKFCFGDSDVGVWVAAHAGEYGFIFRYPDGKTDITGFIREPWHLRYVGLDLVNEMSGEGAATLEEFFGLPAAPDYL